MTTLIDYQPTPLQRRFHEAPGPHRALLGAVGTGKTQALLVELARIALATPLGQFLLLYPKGQGEFRKDALLDLCAGVARQEAGTGVLFHNGARVYFLPGEPGQVQYGVCSLRLHGAVVDDADFFDPEDLTWVYTRVREEGAGHPVLAAGRLDDWVKEGATPMHFTVVRPELADNPYFPGEERWRKEER
jgi:hypothetical protein